MAEDKIINNDNNNHGSSSLEYSCAVCNKNSTQRCSNCRKVSYCCKDHQKADWKNHKPDCFPAEIKYNDIVGRHLVATREIQPGEILLKEKPLVAGPKHCGDKTGKCIFPICLGCFRIVSNKYFCSKCKWPMCNEECEKKASVHLKNECTIFSSRNIRPSFALLKEARAYDNVIVLRALLSKQLEPKVWSKIQSLQTHSVERAKSGSAFGVNNNNGSIPLSTISAAKFIHNICGLKNFTYDEINHVIGAFETNVFGNDDSSVRSSSPHFRASSYLYFIASIPAHDCCPNSTWAIQTNSEFQMKATVPIQCGESITHLYTSATVGTLARRKLLKSTKFFDCSCARCQDSIELGSDFSTLKCQACDNGYMVSDSPLDYSSNWKCLNCDKKETVNFVQKLIQKVSNEINSTVETNSGNEGEIILNFITSFKQLIAKYYPKFLHPNHYLIFEMEIYIIQKISYFLSASSTSSTLEEMKISDILELINFMIELTRKCLQMTSIVLPGQTTLRGRLLYFLQQGFTSKLFILLMRKQQTNGNSSTPSEMDYKNDLNILESAREESILIFCNAPDGREEFLLRKKMLEPSEELKFIRETLSKS